MKEQDVEMLRELISGGMQVDSRLAEYVKESENPTEESYQAKLEQISEYMSEY